MMTDTTEPIADTLPPLHPPLVLEKARAACRRMPPLWPLNHFVAVNPFLGLVGRPFIETCDLLRRVTEGGMLMPPAYFHEQWKSGKILLRDLAMALEQARQSLPEPWKSKAEAMTGQQLLHEIERPSSLAEGSAVEDRVQTAAEVVDRLHGAQWSSTIVEEIARFCAAYYDVGQSAWRMPWQGQPLFSAWQAAAALDAGPELLGLRGFRQFVSDLPEEAEAAIARSLEQLGVAAEDAEDFLHRQLLTIRGWAGYVQYRVRENGMHGRDDDSLLHLLAIRVAYDAALFAAFDLAELRGFGTSRRTDAGASRRELLTHYLWHSAFEHAWQRELLGKLTVPRSSGPARPSGRMDVQAVFCIDVRSEVFRRSLESVSPQIETLGFAGFFGLPIEYIPLGQERGAAQCPVLFTPPYRIRETLRHARPGEEEAALQTRRLGKRIGYSWNSFKTSAVSCFSFVEAAGLAFGAQLFRDAFLQSEAPPARCALGPILDRTPETETGLAPEDQVQLALGALRNMGLTANFARLVLLCGHGSGTVNNPYGSGLDCGACGGHTGEANARVGAAILNRHDVRIALVALGILIPQDTWFLAGLHNTTTDDVTLFDLDEVPTSHRADIATLQSALAESGRRTRRQRAVLLGITDPARLDAQVRARSRDWAQVRPEWGLAGNAAFIVAPRERTRGLDLGGRAFLHNYNHAADLDNATLELIMTAPMVVTNWINLQYYASTVNNPVFGSGNKVLHNVVGTLGVCQGNGGDLQTGLPLQSVHDGTRFIHEPHRLSVVIEAPRERISAIIAKHESVRHLVDHAWLHILAIEDSAFHRYQPGGGWEKIESS